MVTLYRITGSAVPNFFLGTFLLALLTVFAGELTASIAYRLNRKHLRKLSTRMVEMNNASMAALETGRKGEYRARNKEANDALGQGLFQRHRPFRGLPVAGLLRSGLDAAQVCGHRVPGALHRPAGQLRFHLSGVLHPGTDPFRLPPIALALFQQDLKDAG